MANYSVLISEQVFREYNHAMQQQTSSLIRLAKKYNDKHSNEIIMKSQGQNDPWVCFCGRCNRHVLHKPAELSNQACIH